MKPIHVMTVDDSTVVCSLIEMVLSSDKAIDVTHRVGTAREAIDALAAGDIDVITLDLNLPDAQGIDMVELLTATHERGVVVVSGNADQHAVAVRLGATACFDKPHLLDHVQDFINAIHAAAAHNRADGERFAVDKALPDMSGIVLHPRNDRSSLPARS